MLEKNPFFFIQTKMRKKFEKKLKIFHKYKTAFINEKNSNLL